MRVLGRVRLSRATDESTSVERQREVIQRWAADNGHDIVGWAEDLDISGGMDPFETPALGPWLAPLKLHEWDILCCWKLDRISRNSIKLNRVIELCLNHDKTMVSCVEQIDISTPVGRLIVGVIAFLAEGELEAIRERTRSSHRKLRELGRWPGGTPPYGYTAQPRTDGDGWELVINQQESQTLLMIIDRVLDGTPVGTLARQLTDEKVPAPKGAEWSGQTIRRRLRSKTMMGHVIHKTATVRDDAGEPILKAPPIVTYEKYEQIQAVLAARSVKRDSPTKTSPLTGVAFCWDCGGPMHSKRNTVKGKLYRYYRCEHAHGQMIPAEMLETEVDKEVRSLLSDQEVLERVFVPGESHQAEIEQAESAVEELTAALPTLLSKGAKDRVMRQLAALDAKIAGLEELPDTAASFELRPTGQKYGEVWNTADQEGRRRLLVRSGITVRAKLQGRVRMRTYGALQFHFDVPADLSERMT